MKYKVEIVETLRDVVEISASSEEEAIRKVEEMYFNEDIVLGAENFDNDVVFNLLED
ncbi:MAG: DpnD/PcfM family protein [Finegoldia magna]|uniref:DpnD/PcfM family protein n=1 Tax=Finegoldia magna TaxID=1260 RepID=UPI002913D3B1|nr:DpnD/PcfM family protein [Finegoldia magna]MDU5527531.1 DpnD/PcfM family protein [Finegoldia magna]